MKFLLACLFILMGFFQLSSQDSTYFYNASFLPATGDTLLPNISIITEDDRLLIGGEAYYFYSYLYGDTMVIDYGITEYTVSASDNTVAIISIDGECITGWYRPADPNRYDELVQTFKLQYVVGQWHRPGECVLHTLLGDFRIYDHSQPYVPKRILVSEGKNGFIWFKNANDQVLRWDIDYTFKY